jgi:hypothetical protein
MFYQNVAFGTKKIFFCRGANHLLQRVEMLAKVQADLHNASSQMKQFSLGIDSI